MSQERDEALIAVALERGYLDSAELAEARAIAAAEGRPCSCGFVCYLGKSPSHTHTPSLLLCS